MSRLMLLLCLLALAPGTTSSQTLLLSFEPSASDAFAPVVIGDIDHGGWPDLALGDPNTDTGSCSGNNCPSGRLLLHSGLTGDLLLELPSPVCNGLLGAKVAAAGDWDGDGTPDLLVALANDVSSEPLGLVRVYSGADGGLLLGLHGSSASSFGYAAVGAGDLDFDGHADLALGEPFLFGLQDTPGRVHFVSGADGTLLTTLEGSEPGDHFGRSLLPARDFDGDGFHDLLIGGDQQVKILSGRLFGSSVVELPELTGNEPGAAFGAALSGSDDLDGDGAFEVLLGAALGGSPPSPQGQVHRFHLAPQWTPLGGGVAGATGVPLLQGTGSMVTGQSAGLTLSGAPSFAHGRLVFGLSTLSIPFHAGALVPFPDVLVPFVTDRTGSAGWSDLWTGAMPPGSSFFAQAWLLDASAPQGAAGSHALLAQVP